MRKKLWRAFIIVFLVLVVSALMTTGASSPYIANPECVGVKKCY